MMSDGNWSTRQVMVAGAAGGAVEVLWIALATVLLGVEGWQVSRAVTATVFPAYAVAEFAPWVGLAIHFALSFALAAVFVYAAGRRLRGVALFAAATVSLGAVWSINFLVLLPALNPVFTTLLPHPVTLVSKLLFGVAMAAVLHSSAVSSGRSPVSNNMPRS